MMTPADEGIKAGRQEAAGNKVLNAKWITDGQVAVFYGDLHIANVNQTVLGWHTFYLGTGRKNGRKHYEYPSQAIKAYFGKSIQIEAAQ